MAKNGRHSTRPRSRCEFAKPAQTYKRTFRSAIDGSVQYYAVVPALPVAADPAQGRPGLVLTAARRGSRGNRPGRRLRPQAGSAHRRAHQSPPLRLRLGRLGPARRHRSARAGSAGFRDRPAADLPHRPLDGRARHLAPGRDLPRPVRRDRSERRLDQHVVLRRGQRSDSARPVERACGIGRLAPSDTLALSRNLARLGVYILHGDADDNVPVGQARQMRKVLGEFHPDFAYHEQPGAGHWWGNACVDWPPLFAFLGGSQDSRRRRGETDRFRHCQPGRLGRAHWAVDRGPDQGAGAEHGASRA